MFLSVPGKWREHSELGHPIVSCPIALGFAFRLVPAAMGETPKDTPLGREILVLYEIR